ncbi:MAG: hypothetical protein UY50_C0031G0003 [Parcubacteria group bacterium GW2011_GWA2_49_9]|nr:MAG: hypothetical protein UY50_C0031G0003 [Parcubacteria group bacterium GW2011_GWA2_49_9]
MNKTSSYSTLLIQALFLIGTFALFAVPASLSAQSSLRYERNPVNGALYLLPNGGPDEYYSTSANRGTVASALSVSCTSAKLNASVGESVTWFSSVVGGTGSYLYTWNGTDGLSGNLSALSASYSRSGEKFAQLTVTSGNQMTTVSCGSVQIGASSSSYSQFGQAGFGASCYAVPDRIAPGESVTWLAVVSGTSANTTYAWDGTDGLTGDRPLISKTYTSVGIKPALLTVTDGNARIVAACTNAVSVGYKSPVVTQKIAVAPSAAPVVAQTLDIQGICSPSVTQAKVGEEIVWQTAVVGGNGSFQFLWNGDELLSGNASTTTKIYETAGVKKATVAIHSAEKNVTLSCGQVDVTKAGGLMALAFLSWITGPVMVILGLILAILVGVLIARRKKKKEEKEEEKDHVE